MSVPDVIKNPHIFLKIVSVIVTCTIVEPRTNISNARILVCISIAAFLHLFTCIELMSWVIYMKCNRTYVHVCNYHKEEDLLRAPT